MSVRFDDVSEYLSRTANLIDYEAAYTVCFWIYLSTDADNYGHFWAMTAASTEVSGNYEESDFGGFDVDGTTPRSGSFINGSTYDVDTGSSFSTGTWYHVAIRRNSASSLDFLINGSVVINTTQDVSSRAAAGGEWIGRLNGGYPHNGRVAYFKQWSATRTDAEIIEESGYKNAKYTSGIHKVTRLESDLVDEINGYNWTANGTISYEADPPGITVYSPGGGGNPWNYYAQQ